MATLDFVKSEVAPNATWLGIHRMQMHGPMLCCSESELGGLVKCFPAEELARELEDVERPIFSWHEECFIQFIGTTESHAREVGHCALVNVIGAGTPLPRLLGRSHRPPTTITTPQNPDRLQPPAPLPPLPPTPSPIPTPGIVPPHSMTPIPPQLSPQTPLPLHDHIPANRPTTSTIALHPYNGIDGGTGLFGGRPAVPGSCSLTSRFLHNTHSFP